MTSQQPTKAALLAIGTEITSGDIINANASWLAQRLGELPIETLWHLAVPDEKNLILKALNLAVKEADIVIITGGLGPTTDDFTRKVVAEFVGEDLTFYQPSWDKITARLNGLGIAIAESNRQQCFFPKSANVIPNSQGTADAFELKSGGVLFVCLPGPPHEIKAIWEDHLYERLKPMGSSERTELVRYQCLGKSESQLGEIVEEALAGSGFTTGYRPHVPYVEVKVWIPAKDLKRAEPYVEKLKAAIQPWFVTNGDVASEFLEIAKRYHHIEITDCASHGFLAQRLGTQRSGLNLSVLTTEPSSAPLFPEASAKVEARKSLRPESPRSESANTLSLYLSAVNADCRFTVALSTPDLQAEKEIHLPFRYRPDQLERSARFAAEMTLWWARDQLRT